MYAAKRALKPAAQFGAAAAFRQVRAGGEPRYKTQGGAWMLALQLSLFLFLCLPFTKTQGST
jgi:hypothetical protein